jgi:hypothetical protein
MIQLIVLTLVLLTFVFYLFKKEEFQVEDNEVKEEEAPISQEEAEEKPAEEEEELERAITEQIDEINADIRPVLMMKKSYENYNPCNEPYESVHFVESQNKMTNKIEDIPLEQPFEITPFPCRKNEHVWDYTGVHKIAPPSEKCNGIDSAVVPNPISLIHHPSNYVV